MNQEPTETDVLELIKQKQVQKAELGENWLTVACTKEIDAMRKSIATLEELIRLSKNPEVMHALNLFAGRK